MPTAYIVKKGKRPDQEWARRGLTSRSVRARADTATPVVLHDIRWEVRYRLGGRGSSLHTDGTFASKSAADRRLAQIKEDLAAGRDPRRPAEPTGARTVREVVEETQQVLAITLAPNTQRNWRRSIDLLGELGEVPLERVRWQDFEAWHMANLRLKPKTRAIYFGVYRLALDRCDLDPNPARSRNLAKAATATAASTAVKTRVRCDDDGDDHDDDPGSVSCPTHAEVEALLACLAMRRRRSSPSPYLQLVRFMALAGVRACELIGMRCRDVDLERERIWIRTTKAKTRGRRFIPITREMAPLIAELEPGSRPRAEPLFMLEDATGRRAPTANGIYKALMRASRAAGLASTISSHDFRHRNMSRLIMANVPPPMIQKVVGHSNLTSLMRVYAHVLPNEPLGPLKPLRDDVLRFFDEGRDLRTT